MAVNINGFSNPGLGNALGGRQASRIDGRSQAKEPQPQAARNLPILQASPDIQMVNGKKYNFNAQPGSYIDIVV
ncbi:MAG: hypothetical protein FWF01_01415 [Alphaproteobacteria bacterium]|nr:hypothetical protein [Alphaproteobacteria bacterium]